MIRVFFESIPSDAVELNPNEIAARLKTERGYSNETIEMCRDRLQKAVNYKYSYIRVPVSFPGEDMVDIGFAVVKSKALRRNLLGCSEAFVFAVTSGMGVDRLLMKLSLTSPAENFITDALSSAAVEAACDYADSHIKGNLKCKPRFSPGFADLSLDVQPLLISAVNAGKLLGITLSKAYLMSPVKTVTAIMGICAGQDNDKFELDMKNEKE